MAKINLLPAERRPRQINWAKYRPYSPYIALVTVVVGAYLFLLLSVYFLQAEARQLDKDQANLGSAVGQVKQLESDLKRNQQVIAAANGEKLPWHLFLAFISDNLSPNMWISEIRWETPQSLEAAQAKAQPQAQGQQAQNKGKNDADKQQPEAKNSGSPPTSLQLPAEYKGRDVLLIRGASHGAKDIGQFVIRLRQLPYFSHVDLVGAEEYFTGNKVLTVYEIYCVLPQRGGK